MLRSRLFIAGSLTLALLAACGERAERESAAATAPAPASETAESADAPGKTTTFEESPPAPQ